MSSFYSPWVSFEEIAREYELARRDTTRMRAFTNTYLGEAYEEETESVEYQQIYNRRENYKAEVPEGGLVLTAGIDTQDDRLEVEVVAHGINQPTKRRFKQRLYARVGLSFKNTSFMHRLGRSPYE